MLTEHEKKELDERGYVILPDFMGPELLEALRRRVNVQGPSSSRSRRPVGWPTWSTRVRSSGA